jgi:hypothetical protein
MCNELFQKLLLNYTMAILGYKLVQVKNQLKKVLGEHI